MLPEELSSTGRPYTYSSRVSKYQPQHISLSTGYPDVRGYARFKIWVFIQACFFRDNGPIAARDPENRLRLSTLNPKARTLAV